MDEISFVENWERAIKYILDSPLKREKVIYITGSSSIELKKESFPGRPIKIEKFLPLTFKDFCKIFGSKELKYLITSQTKLSTINEIANYAKKFIPYQTEIEKWFYKYIFCGGFPRAFYEFVEEGKIKEETYDIYWNWLVHDIAKIGRSEKILSSILIGILKNYGTKFSLSSISKETEIGSHITAREYLEILENLGAVRNFHNFDLNKRRIIYRKMRKAYFIDPFLYSTFQRKLLGRKAIDESKVVEGIVVEAISRKIKNVGFYHNKKELDIAFENFGIEVKWQEKVSEKDFPKVEVKNKLLLTKNQLEILKKVLLIPAKFFLAFILIFDHKLENLKIQILS